MQEKVALSAMLDFAVVTGGDFRIDSAGHLRFALFVNQGVGNRRVGRVVQRICELETYKSMTMLGFSKVKEMSGEMNSDAEINHLISNMTGTDNSAETTLHALLRVSAELESQSVKSAFRFAATKAYEAIVSQRAQVLREQRFQGRQTFQEFMTCRYEPAMRTVKATELRLAAMTDCATRAGNPLRTRLDVERSAQNQSLLASVDKRADLQLRLQKTVEDLSVVAISYYAVLLTGFLLFPFASLLGASKGMLTAIVTLPVLALVWGAVRRIREKME